MSKDLDGMKAAAGSYYRYALMARRNYLGLLAKTDKEIAAIYHEHLRRILNEYKSGRNSGLVYLLEAIDSDSPEFQGDLTERILNAIEQGAAAGIVFSQLVTMDALDGTGLSKGPITKAFEWQRRQAVNACYARTHKDGLYLSDRIWNTAEDTRKAMRSIVQAGIGEDAVKVARALEIYVNKGKTATCLQFPNMMERMGSRVPENLNYNALRLARTELSAAYGSATIGAAQASPAIGKVKWVLSAAHPKHDICDDNAAGGDGHGVYPANACPQYPAHPNCLCNLQPAPDNPQDFAKKMKEWLDNPSSHPEVEEWYQKNYKRFNNGKKRGFSTLSEQDIIESTERAKIDTLKREIERKEKEQQKRRTAKRRNDINGLHKKLTAARVEAGEKGVILTSGLEKSYGKTEIEAIRAKVKAAPQDIRVAWNRFEDVMNALKTNINLEEENSRYSQREKGIYLNLERDKSGSPKKPFNTTFHELGHLIDHYVGRNAYMSSQVYKGGAFGNMIRSEASDYIINTIIKLRKEASAKGRNAKNISNKEAYESISKELLRLNKIDRVEVSDIWSGATQSEVRGGWGHKKSYWEDPDKLPMEAFAEMFCATINNPESVEIIKQYFPRSYDMFLQMIKEIAERGALSIV